MRWFGRRNGGTAGAEPPLARSQAELELHMTLHPCACGDPTVPSTVSGSVRSDGQRVVEHSGRCPTCGTGRRFAFRVQQPVPGGSMFGAGTSELLDPGDWLWVARHAANGSGDPLGAARTAIAAIEEAAKFVPQGKRKVPRRALRSERSAAMLAADPHAFDVDVLGRLFRPDFSGTFAAPPERRRATTWWPDPLRIQVPGRCPAGSFSPDGTQLAVASGFERLNVMGEGEVSVFAVDGGACLQRHVLEAYEVRVLHTGDGVVVADWQAPDGRLVAGDLVRYRPGRRDVLMEGVGINPMVQTTTGFAALTHQGDLLLGTGDDVRVLPPPGPRNCLATDLAGGRIAAGGDRLVLLDHIGRRLAVTQPPGELVDVAFMGPDQLLGTGQGFLALWRIDGGELRLVARVRGGFSKLVALPAQGLVMGVFGGQDLAVLEVRGSRIESVAMPRQLHGRDVWGSPDGRRVALPDRINDWLPPAPEQVEVHDTRTW